MSAVEEYAGKKAGNDGRGKDLSEMTADASICRK